MRRSLRRLFRVSNPPAGPLKSQPHRKSWTRRFKMMMRHTTLLAIMGLLLCAGVGAAAFYVVTRPTEVKIAVGPKNSEDVRVVEAIAAHLKAEKASVRLNVIVKEGGPIESAKAIESGEADLAVVRRDVAMPAQGQVVAILRKNVVVLFVPAAEPAKAAPARRGRGAAAKPAAKPKVEKIEDLVGKRVAIIGRSQTNVNLLKTILQQYRIEPSNVVVLESAWQPNAPGKINVVQLEVNAENIATTMRDSKADAILAVGPVSSSVTAAAITAGTRDKEAPTFLAIGASEAIAERNPVYESTEIKAGAFGGAPPRPEESVETIGVNHYFVARRRLSEDVVADFTRLLLSGRQSVAASLRSHDKSSEATAVAKIEGPDTDKDAAVPVHPGAAAYIDGELKTFFDRYNDLLYYGLMVFSFFGAALAGLATYTKSDDRARRLRVLEKLLEVTKTARTAENLQQLDELQDETDKVMAGMIHDVEANALDETALAAFSITLDQAQLALSDRRATLLGQPQSSRSRPAVAAL